MKTATATPRHTAFRIPVRVLFTAGILAVACAAHAHHGNPEAPAPTWEGSLPPGTPAPQAPAQPGG